MKNCKAQMVYFPYVYALDFHSGNEIMHILTSLQLWDLWSNILYLIFDSHEVKVEYLMASHKMFIHPNSYFLLTIFRKNNFQKEKYKRRKPNLKGFITTLHCWFITKKKGEIATNKTGIFTCRCSRMTLH